jgi:hypothetical protein
MIDKNIILKIATNYIYNNPTYDNLSSFSMSAIFVIGISVKNILYIENPNDKPYDLNGNQYIKGTGGYINVWINIHYNDMKSSIKGEFIRILYTNYLSEVRNLKLSDMNINIVDKIKSSLDKYLEFDSSEIFKQDMTRIFGGAIRDIIADMPINDVDIICASRAAKRLEFILISNGYNYFEGLNPKDLSSIYTDIKVITEPKTYIKGTKIVQIIKPSKYKPGDIYEENNYKDENYKEALDRLISNVDISCCGLSYDGDKLTENVKDAILHCRNKVFKVNLLSQMAHKDRIINRIAKFERRGWSKIGEDITSNRNIKLDDILTPFDNGYYDYVKSWK